MAINSTSIVRRTRRFQRLKNGQMRDRMSTGDFRENPSWRGPSERCRACLRSPLQQRDQQNVVLGPAKSGIGLESVCRSADLLQAYAITNKTGRSLVSQACRWTAGGFSDLAGIKTRQSQTRWLRTQQTSRLLLWQPQRVQTQGRMMLRQRQLRDGCTGMSQAPRPRRKSWSSSSIGFC